MDFSAIRRRLSDLDGRTYWRSLEEAAETPEFQELLHREFPSQASEFTDPVGRRQFLKLMSASLALAGVGACTRQPDERIVAYVRAPEEIVPGRPLYYATAMPHGGYASPLLVESHMGRPTKIEGNPEHPASLGATDLFAQASVLDLYDPDRLQTLTLRSEVQTWNAFLGAMQVTMTTQRALEGAGVRILTGTVTSPSLAAEIRALLATLPEAKWHQYEPVSRDTARAGARLAFGRIVECHYRFDRADVVLALDADFLTSGPGHVRYARDFSDRRRVAGDHRTMSRLYVAETLASGTGAKADHRLPLAPAAIEALARAAAAGLGVPGIRVPASLPSDLRDRVVPALVKDLQASHGRALVLAGDAQPAVVHALAHAMNRALGAVDETVVYTEPVEAEPVDQAASLADLAADMDAGRVEALFVLGGNPVYDAPADLRFVERVQKVALAVHLTQHENETSQFCHWNVPEAHYLEAWGDARAYDGTASIIQPLIAPLYGGKTATEVLATLGDRPDRTAHGIVKDYWQRALGGETATTWALTAASADALWQTSLHDGVVAGTALPAIDPGPVADLSSAPSAAGGEALTIVFGPDPAVFDGRFANNGWLQEVPRPFSKLTWDNAATVSPLTAERLGVRNTDVVELTLAGRTVRAPIWIVPGQADGCVGLTLGYGRAVVGRVGHGVGVNAYRLRTSTALWHGAGLELTRTGDTREMAATQHHFLMEGRHLVRHGTLAQYLEHPEFVHEMGHTPAPGMTLYPEHEYHGNKWGMAIDLNACNGCNACVVACQSENNIPIVGRDQVARGREMHWIRIDTYFTGDLDHPEAYNQPVPCMQCENAPCEPVCPVAATVHSAEGLNDMVYNRCVGTRYCSNNCPYKVRRFNFLLYQDFTTPQLEMQRNPDVTVRSRGVMEKCTYCVQRINQARIDAKREDRTLGDGAVTTACEQVCPSQAIVFGDLNDPNSRVTRLKAEMRNYGLLEEVNTRPRTTYLAALRNPNPEIDTEA